jgi:hypothetical protein
MAAVTPSGGTSTSTLTATAPRKTATLTAQADIACQRSRSVGVAPVHTACSLLKHSQAKAMTIHQASKPQAKAVMNRRYPELSPRSCRLRLRRVLSGSCTSTAMNPPA